MLCTICGSESSGVGRALGICPVCIRGGREESRRWIEAVHSKSRARFHLPVKPPTSPHGMSCNLCFHSCRMRETELGYCAVRRGNAASLRHDGRSRARVSYYLDPLPTNCVADWVCPGGTGAGYPQYAHVEGPEVGFYNLAVFYQACNFNCLYCQNWTGYKRAHESEQKWLTVEDLAGAVHDLTSCICFFGGDPAPQLPFSLRVCERILEQRPEGIFRVCWETNGSMHPAWLKRMFALSARSGGCIKVDLKAWDPDIHRALCGHDNRQVLENFSRVASWVDQRPDPPPLVASTLLVPGYVDEDEVRNLAKFLAGLNPNIPYSLLAFSPQFLMDDLPATSRLQAEKSLQAAQSAGLRRIHVGNLHLLH
jgi:pyruvate formate lyase activating enzyme